MWNSALQDFFASINKIFILAGRRGTSKVWLPFTPYHFKKGGTVNFDYPPPHSPQRSEGERTWKTKKRGWKYGARAGLLTRGGGWGAYTFPEVYHFSFRNYFTLCKIVIHLIILHLEITLPVAKLCYAFEEKLFFSVTIILWKKAF